VDGSAGAAHAEAWAVADARSRRAPLRLVSAYSTARMLDATSMYGGTMTLDVEMLHAATKTLLTEAAARMAAIAPEVEITTLACDGDAAAVLVGESRAAATIVLGSRGLGALSSVILGSVGTMVSARAECPVVVVRGPAALEPGSTVVLGVQADEDSADAIAYAFDYASRNAVPLHAVLCWHPDALAQMMWRPEQPVPPRAEVWLSEALAGWREKFPDVDVHAAVTRAHPVEGLVAASNGQRLLVVGSHSRGALAGMLLGSVSQGVLHHASCPVAVVPPDVAS
jgi:nucleotide-binding universal stress UspA family protein